jgi:hypothetical protein
VDVTITKWLRDAVEQFQKCNFKDETGHSITQNVAFVTLKNFANPPKVGDKIKVLRHEPIDLPDRIQRAFHNGHFGDISEYIGYVFEVKQLREHGVMVDFGNGSLRVVFHSEYEVVG